MKFNKRITEGNLLQLFICFSCCLLMACGGAGGSKNDGGLNPVKEPPGMVITRANFRDTDGDKGTIGGELNLSISSQDRDLVSDGITLRIYWAHNEVRSGEIWFELDNLTVDSRDMATVLLPDATQVPSNVNALKLYLSNDAGESREGLIVRFHDFSGNSLLSGPGGNEAQSWYYGIDRAKIPVHQTNDNSPVCVFDNGLVSVVDMENQRDESLHTGSNKNQANQADDLLFAPYSFQCGPDIVNEFREISDEYGVWTYSTLNDSMFYGTIVYDAFLST